MTNNNDQPMAAIILFSQDGTPGNCSEKKAVLIFLSPKRNGTVT